MTAEPLDLYTILGVEPSATPDEITHAYRTLLRYHHPDTRLTRDDVTNAASDTALQQVLRAYTVLRDPARRTAYDRHTRTQPQPPPPQAPRAPTHHDQYRKPPIIVGPVRWHPGR